MPEADVTIRVTSASATIGAIGEVVLTLDTTRFKFHQIPTPTPNGVVTAFTIAEAYVANSLTVYRDQLALQGGVDFAEVSADAGTFSVTVAPDTGEVLWCNYIKQ